MGLAEEAVQVVVQPGLVAAQRLEHAHRPEPAWVAPFAQRHCRRAPYAMQDRVHGEAGVTGGSKTQHRTDQDERVMDHGVGHCVHVKLYNISHGFHVTL